MGNVMFKVKLKIVMFLIRNMMKNCDKYHFYQEGDSFKLDFLKSKTSFVLSFKEEHFKK